ncbi:MAG: glycosyltransferase [Acidimicrobiia bacterium]|nr:glycosyltransferase [Acidimicrobiia bacterium]
MTASPIRVAFIGTFPPTACGIATFTESLRDAMVAGGEVTAGVIRLTADPTPSHPVPADGVVAEWVPGDESSLQAGLTVASSFDCVILQHEFGIFGGADGEEAVEFVESCDPPVITVLHTVVPDPTPHQRELVERIVAASSVSIVQTDSARDRLVTRHEIDEESLVVIPHGAVANFEGPRRPLLGEGRPTILTWGLLGPGKGIEHGIRAIALMSGRTGVPSDRNHAPPTYVVAGRTHPNILATQGEAYRESLEALAARLGVTDRVVFDDAYRDFPSLRELIRGADLILLPYDSRDQVTSGVLVEALASARPVVATAFPHAIEALGGGAGIVVPHEDPRAMAAAIDEILGDPDRHRAMTRAAKAEAASVLWPNVGAAYLALARKVTPTLAVA